MYRFRLKQRFTWPWWKKTRAGY